MPKLEKEEEQKIRQWCVKQNIMFIKFTPMGDKGWPDRIAILPNGVHIWIELKREGRKPSKLQHHRLQKLIDHNVMATWFDTADKAIDFLRNELDAIYST